MYSSNSGSISPEPPEAGVMILRRVFGSDSIGAEGEDDSHAGALPQTSHAPQDDHFGVSPKCWQIW
jgi:hypothetical protein